MRLNWWSLRSDSVNENLIKFNEIVSFILQLQMTKFFHSFHSQVLWMDICVNKKAPGRSLVISCCRKLEKVGQTKNTSPGLRVKTRWWKFWKFVSRVKKIVLFTLQKENEFTKFIAKFKEACTNLTKNGPFSKICSKGTVLFVETFFLPQDIIWKKTNPINCLHF